MSKSRATFGDAPTVLAALRADLQCDASAATDDVVALVAAAIRRLSGFMCPCSQAAISRAAKRSLRELWEDHEAAESFVDHALEDLLVGGDLLELSHVAATDLDDKPTWVFCAPPAFMQSEHRVYIFGIAPDDAPFLPSNVLRRLRCDGATRFIERITDDDLVEVLSALGLRELQESKWLTKVTIEAPASFIERIQSRLIREGIHGSFPEFSLLKHATEVRQPYQERWVTPQAESGLFVARAAQPYGAPIWYMADINEGRFTRSLVLPFHDIPTRACDQAWRLQLAIDAEAGHPATYRMSSSEGGIRVLPSFPLPLAEKRKLLYLGGVASHSARYDSSFWVPNDVCAAAEQILASLWLRRLDEPLT